MKKGLVVLLISLVFATSVNAQVLQDGKTTIRPQINEAKQTKNRVVLEDEKIVDINQEVDSLDIKEEEDIPPAEVTAEEKIERIYTARKGIHSSIGNKNSRERRAIIDALAVMEKNGVRRNAMAEGQSEKEAQKAEKEIKPVKVNEFDDDSIEEFIYQKTGLKKLEPKELAETDIDE